MKILCHVAPWCAEQFKVIAEAVSPDADIQFISGFRQLDRTGLVETYYRNVAADRGDDPDERDEETILRCRLLRSLPAEQARRHCSAMRGAIREVLLREKPDLIICESIDQFLHDILFQEADRQGVLAVGLIRTFVNNYFRFSARGEFQVVRSPEEAEIDEVLSLLTDARYIPKNLVPLKASLTKTYFRIYLSNHLRVLYFGLKRLLTGQRYNYHYWSSYKTTRELYAHLIPKRSFGDEDWRERLRRSSKPVLFIPLQHFPEATVDYWAEDTAMVDYPRRLLEFMERLAGAFTLLVKEHPGVWGYRKPAFYRQLEAVSGDVICAPTPTKGQECIELSSAVLVWTGSVGFEAALRGKPVLTTCTPYYATGPRFQKITLQTPLADILQFVRQTEANPITAAEQRDLIRHLLSGILPGQFKNDGSFDAGRADDIAQARRVGAWIQTCLVAPPDAP
ncbi:hypothetical protein [Alkalilimnicola sp. S0819]|uniref:capsular polysaccharide export protein, LipB/KpsS family n=1 Tax=Alkalilimnicola sp. S0819 TaxID=2613922 RepID=UPI00186A3C5C|nr:hypothetical protein [Alkalilimnicola sp. S0819]